MSAETIAGTDVAPASVTPVHTSRAANIACRTLDIALSALLLVVLMPVLLAVALAVRLDSPGPSLFRQKRLGRDMDPFVVNKFRTMRHGADHERHRAYVLSQMNGSVAAANGHGPRYKLTDDERVTRFGRLLRRTSLDELPQLWNVLRGHMSLVGPRPPIPYEVANYPPDWFKRFAVKPGLTGLWQVSGRSELTYEDMVRLDVEYIASRSLWLNLWIIVRTVPVVLSTRGAN